MSEELYNPEPVAPPTAPSPAPVPESLHCLRCGYALTGLTVTGSCPECGTPVAQAMRGNLLEFSAPEHLRVLHVGALLIEIAIGISICGAVLSIFFNAFAQANSLMDDLVNGMAGLFQFGASVLGLVGWWALTTQDPAQINADPSATVRKVLRTTLVMQTVAIAIGYGSYFSSSGFGTVPSATAATLVMSFGIALIIVASAITKTFAALFYIRLLGERLPDQAITKRASSLINGAIVLSIMIVVAVIWGLTIRAFGGLIFIGSGVVWLVLFFLYVGLIDMTRLRLKGVRARAAARALA